MKRTETPASAEKRVLVSVPVLTAPAPGASTAPREPTRPAAETNSDDSSR